MSDRAVDDIGKRAAAFEMEFEIFANAVENDDSVINGVADDSEESGDERGIDLALSEGKNGKDDKNVMDECGDSGDTEVELKAESDVSDNERPRNEQG